MKKIAFLLSLLVVLMVQCKSSKTTTMNTPAATLENTYWKLAEMNGQPVITPQDAKEVHMVLGPEQRVKGFAGCNSIGGNYTLNGTSIKFTTISTKMFCQDRMDVENFLLNTLTKANTFKINGETLELYEGNTLLTTFRAVYLK